MTSVIMIIIRFFHRHGLVAGHRAGAPEARRRGVLAFLIPLMVVLLLITYIPGLTLWLPNLLLGPDQAIY